MADTQHLIAREMDLDRPCAARIFDAFLGGNHNFGVERRFVERAAETLPGITTVYRENRAFLRRVVELLLEKGVHQFLNLGSGIPTIGHVHEIARRRTRHFRVLYVDNEPLTVAHSRPLLADEPRAQIMQADLRAPDSILHAPQTRELLDLDRPVGLLMSAVLHFVTDAEEPSSLVGVYHDALARGSHVAVSHLTDAADPASMRTLHKLYADSADPLVARDTDRIAGLFSGFEPLSPGLRSLSDWRPDPDQAVFRSRYQLLHGGLGEKTGRETATITGGTPRPPAG